MGAPIEDRSMVPLPPQWAGRSTRAPGGADLFDPVENAQAAARYVCARYGPPPWESFRGGEGLLFEPKAPSGRLDWTRDTGSLWQLDGVRLVEIKVGWRERPPAPWWARALAWMIAIYYAVQR